MRLKIRILPTQVTVIHGLSNRAIFNDTERPQTQISKSDHSLALNISEMAKDAAIVTVEYEIRNRTQPFEWYHLQRP